MRHHVHREPERAEARARLWAMTLVAASLAAPAVALADPSALPNYLGAGFPVETFDPAPAGDRFVTTPSALIVPAFTTQLTGDVLFHPVEVRVGGVSVTHQSHAAYLHPAITVAPCEWFEISGDLPVVLSQAITVDGAAQGMPAGDLVPPPYGGDVGDARVGTRIPIPPFEKPGLFELAVAGDAWLGTGNAETLTGAPANRLRGMFVASGRGSPLAPLTLEYAVASGVQSFTSAVNGSRNPAIPLRVAGGIDVLLPHEAPFDALLFSVEYAGLLPTSAERVGYDLQQEGLASAGVSFGCEWTARIGGGVGLSESMGGVPRERFLLSLAYSDLFGAHRCD
jgi:hypothetical protein